MSLTSPLRSKSITAGTSVGNLGRRRINATRSTGRWPQASVSFTAISSATLGPNKGIETYSGRLERDRKVTLFKSDDSESEGQK